MITGFALTLFIGVAEGSTNSSKETYRLTAILNPPKDEDPFTWAVEQGHVLTWVTVLPSLHGASEFRQDIDPSKGLTVGSLRNKIQNFAATMRSIGSEENGSR